MRIRLIGAILTAALMPAAWAQAPQAQAPKGTAANASAAKATARIGGHPNLNGIWQVLNTANWNLEAHSAEDLGDKLWPLGAIGAIPAGKSLLKGGGNIPYLPAALAQRNKNQAAWPYSDPEAKCYMLGVPRVTYHDMPFQIFQGAGDADLLMVYPFEATNRIIYMKDHSEPPIPSWMGKSDGHWDGDTLVVVTVGQYDRTWLDRAGNFHTEDLKVTERFSLMDADHIHYEATLEDPKVYSKPWTIEMPLYRVLDDNAEILEHKCVRFADKLLYHDLIHPGDPNPAHPTDGKK